MYDLYNSYFGPPQIVFSFRILKRNFQRLFNAQIALVSSSSSDNQCTGIKFGVNSGFFAQADVTAPLHWLIQEHPVPQNVELRRLSGRSTKPLKPQSTDWTPVESEDLDDLTTDWTRESKSELSR